MPQLPKEEIQQPSALAEAITTLRVSADQRLKGEERSVVFDAINVVAKTEAIVRKDAECDIHTGHWISESAHRASKARVRKDERKRAAKIVEGCDRDAKRYEIADAILRGREPDDRDAVDREERNKGGDDGT